MLSVFFIEVALRTIHPNKPLDLEKWAPTNDSRNYENRANSAYYVNGISYSINGDGIRAEKNYSFEKNITRLAILGDSVAFGLGVPFEKTFGNLLQERFGNQMEVINFAVPGYGTFAEKETLLRKSLNYDPDAVLLAFVMNDIEPSWIPFVDGSVADQPCILPILNAKVSCRAKNALRKIRTIDFFYSGFASIFSDQTQDYYSISWGSPELYRKNIEEPLSEFKEICDSNGIECAVVIFPLLDFNSTHYGWKPQEDKLINLLKELNISHLSLTQTFQKEVPKNLGATENDILHPNELGNRFAEEEIFDFLTKKPFYKRLEP